MKALTISLQVIVVLLVSLALPARAQTPEMPERSLAIAVGELAPDFTLADQNNQQVTLAAARDRSPVVLVFYRGYW